MFCNGINSINNKKINVRESYIIRQVMRLNSSEERGNEHHINGGPTQNCYEPKTIVGFGGSFSLWRGR